MSTSSTPRSPPTSSSARRIVPVTSVQNRFNLTDRSSSDVLDHCTEHHVGFIPWFPMAAGSLARLGAVVDRIVGETGATPAQVSLAWLLRRSPVMLPIPGTRLVDYVQENCGAARIELTDEQVSLLDAASGSAR
ncbi:MAG: aldo/keto reductase [Acidimicrobiales bacterium]